MCERCFTRETLAAEWEAANGLEREAVEYEYLAAEIEEAGDHEAQTRL